MSGDKFDLDRNQMVEEQLVYRGIRDHQVLTAMRKVPRHLFVPLNLRQSSYTDGPLAIGSGQTISQPYMVALMVELLALTGTEKVLELGTGSGYETAILAELCQSVVSIERMAALAQNAQKILAELGYTNVAIIVEDGTAGYAAQAPYQAIVVSAGAPSIPEALVEQLDEGGRLVIPVGDQYMQTLVVGIKKNGRLETQNNVNCTFVPLIGKAGWSQN
jgi:protein-L-isoaspartate(D-aspartate) O-methyltransferase